jgi:predicted O-linked N-acetylglucosamine transferase (SPINDLY family)
MSKTPLQRGPGIPPIVLLDALRRAMRAHSAGNLGEAEALYKLVLDHDRKNFDRLRLYPPRLPTRRDLELPESAFIYCSFANLYKITPQTFDIWMRILHQTGDSILWLLTEGAIPEGNLRRAAGTRGIAPERLVFGPRVH